jgi:hypothetical protein
MLSSDLSSNRSEPFDVWTFSATWFVDISTSSSVILDQVLESQLQMKEEIAEMRDQGGGVFDVQPHLNTEVTFSD